MPIYHRSVQPVSDAEEVGGEYHSAEPSTSAIAASAPSHVKYSFGDRPRARRNI